MSEANRSSRDAPADYQALAIAECWGDRGWRAGVLVRADDPRGDRPAKSLGHRVFDSREAALEFARSEYGGLDPA
ncbi:MAG: hypothetical protein M3Z29_12825 [Pseudomonadota bacterium]|nr:hypothetical protein [Pseudomonadota bacterium]